MRCHPAVFLTVLVCLSPRLARADGGVRTSEPATTVLLRLDGNSRNAVVDTGQPQEYGTLTWVPGREGRALKMDGTTELLLNPSGYLSVGDDSWTCEAWIQPAPQQPRHAYLLSSGPASHHAWGLEIADRSHLVAYFSAGSAAVARSHDVRAALFDGEWHHVAAVLDRTNAGHIRLYLDGRNVTEGTVFQAGRVARDSRRATLVVGHVMPRRGRGRDGYRGLIDEIRVTRGVREPYRMPPGTTRPATPPDAGAMGPIDADAARPLTLTPAGTLLVGSDHPQPGDGEQKALSLLQRHLRRACGSKDGFEIVGQSTLTDDAARGKALIAVGTTRWRRLADTTKLSRWGYRIRSIGDVIVIAGATGPGSFYGAVDFLDRCGVRFYMPGELFISAPADGPPPLRALDVVGEPYVTSSSATGFYNDRSESVWAERVALTRRLGGTHQHNMNTIFDPDRFAERYPDLYPMLPVKSDDVTEYKRYIPTERHDQRWQPCLSSPPLVDAAEESVLHYFRRDPAAQYVAVSMNDSHAFCECPRCRKAMEAAGGRREGLSKMVYAMMNALAKRLDTSLAAHGIDPDKRLVFLIYGPVRALPAQPLHPRITAFMVEQFTDVPLGVLGIGDDRVRLRPELRGKGWLATAEAIFGPIDNDWVQGVWGGLDDWNDQAAAMGWHDWAHGSGFFIPRLYTGRISLFYQIARHNGMNLRYAHTECYPNWGMDGPQYYLRAKILWDPHVDVARLWRQFCQDMFGPASDEMLDYFRTLEEFWATPSGGPKIKLFRWAAQFHVTGPNDRRLALVRQARGHLDKAARLADADLPRRRIELFSKTFRLTEMLFDLSAAAQVTPQQLDAVRRYVRTELLPDPMTLFRKTYLKEAGHAEVLKNLDRCLAQITRRNVRPG